MATALVAASLKQAVVSVARVTVALTRHLGPTYVPVAIATLVKSSKDGSAYWHMDKFKGEDDSKGLRADRLDSKGGILSVRKIDYKKRVNNSLQLEAFVVDQLRALGDAMGEETAAAALLAAFVYPTVDESRNRLKQTMQVEAWQRSLRSLAVSDEGKASALHAIHRALAAAGIDSEDIGASNRSQALKKVAELGPAWDVYTAGGFSRGFYVGRKDKEDYVKPTPAPVNYAAPGDRISFDGDNANEPHQGTVTDVKDGYISIKWDDGYTGMTRGIPETIALPPSRWHIKRTAEGRAAGYKMLDAAVAAAAKPQTHDHPPKNVPHMTECGIADPRYSSGYRCHTSCPHFRGPN